MATELNTAELSIDEEIDQIANDIANEIEYELAEDSNESPDKPGAGGTGSAPESGKVTKAATPKGKKLTNMRASGTDETVRLTPPRIFSLEEAMEFVAGDELVEVTPSSIRLRKAILDHSERKKSEKAVA